MATAKKVSARARRGNPALRNRRWPKVLLVLGVLAALTAWYYRGTVMARAVAGTAYGARVACSCRFVGGRDLKDCEKDFEPGMGMVSLSEDDDAKSVTASVPLLASQTATFRPGYGCMLEKWEH
ncbi:MAG: hypothetical protein J7496_13055 [Novosphingobium sp.]|nr:hypothetical protein [Novosphingobium sp.]MBO9603425.1 hypothetical protein [Novosphingobium sp.]